jgi:hypothetical protein
MQKQRGMAFGFWKMATPVKKNWIDKQILTFMGPCTVIIF